MKIYPGTTRKVFIIKDKAYKIPYITRGWYTFIYGIMCNLNEKRTWRWNSGKYESGYSHLLCPVLWCSWFGLCLVMPRVEHLTKDPDYGLFKHFEGDDKRPNYGKLNGVIVKIDYAS